MFGRKKLFLLVCLALILYGPCLWAGDVALFVDLGFSPDGKTYMFAQYGVQSESLRPWADLYVVDVPQNNFVPGGKISYVHTVPVIAGQDGSGALYRLIAQNAALAERHKINYIFQGQPLFIALNGQSAPESAVEFRDFEQGASYRASLVSSVEGSGANLRSSFHINLERTGRDGKRQTYTVGTPQLKRPLIGSYGIKKVMVAPHDGSIIFVIEMKKQTDNGFDVRYMVEALKL
jgi:predicted secreted protein